MRLRASPDEPHVRPEQCIRDVWAYPWDLADTYVSIRRSSIGNVIVPSARTASWKVRRSNFGPSACSALWRSVLPAVLLSVVLLLVSWLFCGLIVALTLVGLRDPRLEERRA